MAETPPSYFITMSIIALIVLLAFTNLYGNMVSEYGVSNTTTINNSYYDSSAQLHELLGNMTEKSETSSQEQGNVLDYVLGIPGSIAQAINLFWGIGGVLTSFISDIGKILNITEYIILFTGLAIVTILIGLVQAWLRSKI